MISKLYRYPVKGFSGESLSKVKLIYNEGIIGDRAYAIARQPGLFDPDVRRTTNKNNFLMLMRDEALASLETSFDDDVRTLSIKQGHKLFLQAPLDHKAGRNAICIFLKEYLKDESLSPVVERSPGYKFTDLSSRSPEKMRAISLINMNSVHALEKATRQYIDPRRFRANIYFDNVPAFEEFNWIDKTIGIGSAQAKVTMRTKRCAATQVNPETARRDIDIPKELRDHFGHSEMGIYAEISTTGTVSISDQIGAI